MAKKVNEVKTVEELRAELCEKVSDVNAKYASDAAESEVSKAIVEANEIVKRLNRLLCKEELARLRNAENTMLEAIKSHSYTIQKLVKQVNKDTDVTSYSIDTGSKQTNLRELNDFVENGIGRVSGWTYRIMDFARVMAAKDAAELGCDWKRLADTFKIKKNVERTQIKNPTSMSSKVELLQKIIDDMYFVPFIDKDGKADDSINGIKITSRDIKYIEKATGGKGRTKLSVKTAQGHNDSMIMLVHDILHHHVTGAEYSVEYKAN